MQKHDVSIWTASVGKKHVSEWNMRKSSLCFSHYQAMLVWGLKTKLFSEWGWSGFISRDEVV